MNERRMSNGFPRSIRKSGDSASIARNDGRFMRLEVDQFSREKPVYRSYNRSNQIFNNHNGRHGHRRLWHDGLANFFIILHLSNYRVRDVVFVDIANVLNCLTPNNCGCCILDVAEPDIWI